MPARRIQTAAPDEGRSLAADLAEYGQCILYSRVYKDEKFQYRHVEVPKPLSKYLPKGRPATYEECLRIGITMSLGWWNYEINGVPQTIPNTHVVLFKKVLEPPKVVPPVEPKPKAEEQPGAREPQTPHPEPGVPIPSPIVVLPPLAAVEESKEEADEKSPASDEASDHDTTPKNSSSETTPKPLDESDIPPAPLPEPVLEVKDLGVTKRRKTEYRDIGTQTPSKGSPHSVSRTHS